MAVCEWAPPTGNASSEVRNLLRVVFGIHSTFKEEIWLWRGESDARHKLEPGMHTRIRTASGASDEGRVVQATADLIKRARTMELDTLEGVTLPDLALLAHLQHHGAATPLLDVSVDPLVGLWMVANASGDNLDGNDDRAGRLIGIRRPAPRRWLDTFDARPYGDPDPEWPSGSVSAALASDGVSWYRPPEVSERLRIQRGSFLISSYSPDAAGLTSLKLKVEPDPADANWLSERIDQLGQPGRPRKAGTEVFVLRIRAGLKDTLRNWLEDRAGLSRSVIYPTPWHRPHLEAFAKTYGRGRPLEDD